MDCTRIKFDPSLNDLMHMDPQPGREVTRITDLQTVEKLNFVLILRIMQEFSVERVHQMFGGPIFEGRKGMLQSGSLKIWGNFSKICRKINKNLKNYGENSRNNAKNLLKLYKVSGGNMETIRNITWKGYNGGSSEEPTKLEKLSRHLAKFVM